MNFLNKLIFYKSKQFSFVLITTLILYFISNIKYKITALFIITISNFILKILDSGTMTLVSMSIGLLLKMFSTETLLEAFCQPILWQIMCFLFLSQALIKSNLAHKISIYIMYYFGQSTLTLCFGFCFLSTFFAFILPTSTARMGGIFIPIVSSIFKILSKADQKLKDTIIKIIIYSNTVASAMFFSASSGNFYIQEMTKSLNVYISEQVWIWNGIIPGLVCLITITIGIHKFMNPFTKNLKKINKKIEEEIISFDSLNSQELIILAIFVSIPAMWFIAPKFHISILGILFSILSILLILDILNFEKDILRHTEAWSLFFWMSNLLMLSSLIAKYDSFGFLSTFLSSKFLTLIPSQLIFLSILTFYGYSQYFFASSTVHASALYIVCFNICIKYGYQPFVSALILAYVSNLFAGLTTYSASEVILLCKTFDVEQNQFNKHAFFISSCIFVIWLLTGLVWWKFTGIY